MGRASKIREQDQRAGAKVFGGWQKESPLKQKLSLKKSVFYFGFAQ